MNDYHDTQEELSQAHLLRGREIAEENKMTFSLFKSHISRHLTTENSEDEWTLDYSLYLESIGRTGNYENILDWGSFYYYDRWKDL